MPIDERVKRILELYDESVSRVASGWTWDEDENRKRADARERVLHFINQVRNGEMDGDTSAERASNGALSIVQVRAGIVGVLRRDMQHVVDGKLGKAVELELRSFT